eukprot:UN05920
MWSLIVFLALLTSAINSQQLVCTARAGIPLVGCNFQDYPIRGTPNTCQTPDRDAGESCFIWRIEGDRMNIDIYDSEGCNTPRTPGGVWISPGGSCFTVNTCQASNGVMSITRDEFNKCSGAFGNHTQPALIKNARFMQ